MLEQDYLSLAKHEGTTAPIQGQETNQLGSQIVREIVIPELTKEVNEDKNFSQLRQVYNSLILATWYKKKIKDSILEQVYADKKKVAGVNIDDPQETQRIYQRYLQAFKKGVYNYIKEDVDPATQETIPRKYFSGGTALNNIPLRETIDGAMINSTEKSSQYVIDAAMNVTVLKSAVTRLGNAIRLKVSGSNDKELKQGFKDFNTFVDHLSSGKVTNNDLLLMSGQQMALKFGFDKSIGLIIFLKYYSRLQERFKLGSQAPFIHPWASLRISERVLGLVTNGKTEFWSYIDMLINTPEKFHPELTGQTAAYAYGFSDEFIPLYDQLRERVRGNLRDVDWYFKREVITAASDMIREDNASPPKASRDVFSFEDLSLSEQKRGINEFEQYLRFLYDGRLKFDSDEGAEDIARKYRLGEGFFYLYGRALKQYRSFRKQLLGKILKRAFVNIGNRVVRKAKGEKITSKEEWQAFINMFEGENPIQKIYEPEYEGDEGASYYYGFKEEFNGPYGLFILKIKITKADPLVVARQVLDEFFRSPSAGQQGPGYSSSTNTGWQGGKASGTSSGASSGAGNQERQSYASAPKTRFKIKGLIKDVQVKTIGLEWKRVSGILTKNNKYAKKIKGNVVEVLLTAKSKSDLQAQKVGLSEVFDDEEFSRIFSLLQRSLEDYYEILGVSKTGPIEFQMSELLEADKLISAIRGRSNQSLPEGASSVEILNKILNSSLYRRVLLGLADPSTPKQARAKLEQDYTETPRRVITTADDIKRAYRRQAMKYHSDTNNNDPVAEIMFKEATEAYNVLTDSNSRQNYDVFIRDLAMTAQEAEGKSVDEAMTIAELLPPGVFSPAEFNEYEEDFARLYQASQEDDPQILERTQLDNELIDIEDMPVVNRRQEDQLIGRLVHIMDNFKEMQKRAAMQELFMSTLPDLRKLFGKDKFKDHWKEWMELLGNRKAVYVKYFFDRVLHFRIYSEEIFNARWNDYKEIYMTTGQFIDDDSLSGVVGYRLGRELWKDWVGTLKAAGSDAGNFVSAFNLFSNRSVEESKLSEIEAWRGSKLDPNSQGNYWSKVFGTENTVDLFMFADTIRKSRSKDLYPEEFSLPSQEDYDEAFQLVLSLMRKGILQVSNSTRDFNIDSLEYCLIQKEGEVIRPPEIAGRSFDAIWNILQKIQRVRLKTDIKLNKKNVQKITPHQQFDKIWPILEQSQGIIKSREDLNFFSSGLLRMVKAVGSKDWKNQKRFRVGLEKFLDIFTNEEIREYWEIIVSFVEETGEDSGYFLTNGLPAVKKMIHSKDDLKQWCQRYINLSKLIDGKSINLAINIQRDSDVFAWISEHSGDPMHHFDFYLKILSHNRRLGIRIWENLVKAVKIGLVSVELPEAEQNEILGFINQTHGFNLELYRLYKSEGQVGLRQAVFFSRSVLDDKISPADLESQIDQFNQAGYDGRSLALAGVQMAIPPSGSSTILNKKIAELFQSYITAGDHRNDVPEALRGQKINPQEIERVEHILKKGSRFDADGQIKGLIAALTYPDLFISEADKIRAVENDKNVFIRALRRYLSTLPSERETQRKDVLGAFYAYARHIESLRERIDAITQETQEYTRLGLLNDLFFNVHNFDFINEIISKEIEPTLLLQKGKQAVDDPQALKRTLEAIVANTHTNLDQKYTQISNMLGIFDERSVQENLLPLLADDIQLKPIVERVAMDGTMTRISPSRLVEDLLADPLNVIQAQKDQFEIKKSEKKIKLSFRAVKGIGYGLWGLLAGVCNADDIDLWKKKEFYLLAMIDDDSNEAVGFVSMFAPEKPIDDKKTLVVPGIDPSVEFLSTVDERVVYPMIERALREVAKKEGYETIYLPVNKYNLSNRTGIQNEAIRRSYKRIKLRTPIVWNSRPEPYPIDEVYDMPVDAAMVGEAKEQVMSENGGIDLTPANMNLQTQNPSGEIKFHLDPAMLAQLQNAPGFVPVIINVQPMNNLREFLGIDATTLTPV